MRIKQTPTNRILHKDVYFQETGYIPHRAQRTVQYSDARHRVCSNGRRWGKTLLGGKEAEVTAFVLNSLQQPQRGWIIGPNYLDCEKEFRVVYDSLKILGVDKLSSKFLRNVENGSMHIATNWGWDLQCRSAAHPETLVGEGLDFVLMVEAGRLHRRTFTEYVRPALSDKRGWSLITGVPEVATDTSLLYWGYQRGQDSSKEAWASWQMPSWSNKVVFPGGRTDPEILDAEDDLTKDEFDRQYGGMFVERVGRVMQEWDDDIHLADLQYNPDWPLYAACDFGFTNHWVWLLIQVDEFDNVYVIQENIYTLRDTEDIAREELKRDPLTSQIVAIYPDPSSPDDHAILNRTLNIPIRANTGGEIKTRLALIRKALKTGPAHLPLDEQKPRLFVDRKCTTLSWEMREGYRWPEHKSDVKNDSENPMDKNNHGPEALGRFFRGYFDIVGDQARKSRKSKMKFKR